MKFIKRIAPFLVPPLILSGCLARTVYVPHGAPVRIRKTIPGAQVWVMEKDGTITAGRIDIPEGWYALPLNQESDR